jgi:Type I phosphodiesterase / nucleotide pyrophosphatase
VGPSPVVPDYAGACISNLVPALLGRDGPAPPWLPPVAAGAGQVVLLVVDGLGWEQLEERRPLLPTLAAMAGGPITAAAPSTTATCLTSITTGLPPGRHGVVGYRVHVGGGEVLNVLRWRTQSGDATGRFDPAGLAPEAPFCGTSPAVVTRAEFAGGGFSDAHLRGARHHGWRMPSSLPVEVGRLLAEGEPFVYAYYDGVDKVAHGHGLGRHYEAELAAADRLVAAVLEVLPAGAALVVTSDHGQVEVGDRLVTIAPPVLDRAWLTSGEGRFRWLHARPGMQVALAEAAMEAHADQAWVVTADEVVAGGWLGDVALVARAPVAFVDPADAGDSSLVSRHGSLTGAEMLVPLLAAG